MKKADISLFESLEQHQGHTVCVSNAKTVKNASALMSALSLVSGLPSLAKASKMASNNKVKKVADKVVDVAKNMVSAAGATASTALGFATPPEDVAASIEATPSLFPEKFIQLGNSLLRSTDQRLDSLVRKIAGEGDPSMVGPIVMAALCARGLLSAEQANFILSQNNDLVLPFLCSSAKAGFSFASALKLFQTAVK